MMFRALAFALLAISTPSVARDLTLTAAPEPSQNLQYQNGKQGMSSKALQSEAALIIVDGAVETGRRIKLVVGARNLQPNPINFHVTNVIVGDDVGDLHVFTADELSLEVQRTIKKKRFWAGVEDAISGPAPHQEVGQVNGYVGGEYFQGNVTTTVQPSAEEIEAYRSRMVGVRQRRDDRYGAMRQAAVDEGFKPGTIVQGGLYVTAMTIEAPHARASKLRVTIRANGDEHVFQILIR